MALLQMDLFIGLCSYQLLYINEIFVIDFDNQREIVL